MLQPESVNRIRNIYSQAEKQSQIKWGGFLRTFYLCSGSRETWRESLKSTIAWGFWWRRRASPSWRRWQAWLHESFVCDSTLMSSVLSKPSLWVSPQNYCCLVCLNFKSHKFVFGITTVSRCCWHRPSFQLASSLWLLQEKQEGKQPSGNWVGLVACGDIPAAHVGAVSTLKWDSTIRWWLVYGIIHKSSPAPATKTCCCFLYSEMMS